MPYLVFDVFATSHLLAEKTQASGSRSTRLCHARNCVLGVKKTAIVYSEQAFTCRPGIRAKQLAQPIRTRSTAGRSFEVQHLVLTGTGDLPEGCLGVVEQHMCTINIAIWGSTYSWA